MEELELRRTFIRNVGIVGAKGFIGRKLACELARNNCNIFPWRREVEGDFLSKAHRDKFVAGNSLDVIYQAAWANIENTNYRNDKRNLHFTEASLELASYCNNNNVLSVFLGSTFADFDLNLDHYSTSKRMLQNELRRSSYRKTILVKPTYVFSVEDKRPHLFKQLVDWFESKQFDVPFQIKSKDSRIDLIHVNDVATALSNLPLDSSEFKEYLVTSGFEISVESVIKFVTLKLSGIESQVALNHVTKTSYSENCKVIVSNLETLSFFGLNDMI